MSPLSGCCSQGPRTVSSRRAELSKGVGERTFSTERWLTVVGSFRMLPSQIYRFVPPS